MGILHVVEPTSFIASVLAPAVALSACAILTSNAQTKYSGLVDRLRSLNSERRDFEDSDPVSPGDALRIKSLDRQIALIFRRLRHLRDAMVLFFFAMACIILTSFSIAAEKYFHARGLMMIPEGTFVTGLILVLLALIEELFEVRLTFRVVRYELGLFDDKAAKEVERRFRGV